MKTSKFILWQIKKWLPLIAVMLILCSAFTWITALNTSYMRINDDHIYYYHRFETNFEGLFTQILIMGLVMPFFALSYRFDKRSADAYNAFPARADSIRKIKVLLGAAVIFSIFSIVFFGKTLIEFLMYLSTPEVLTRFGHTYVRASINFNVELLSYFYFIVVLLSSYFFNCTVVGLGNTLSSSVIYTFVCNFILMMFVGSPAIWSSSICSAEVGNTYDFIGGYYSDSCMINELSLAVTRFGSLAASYPSQVSMIIAIITLIIRGLVGFFGFTKNDPSGEYFGAPGAYKNWHKYIIYASLVILAILISADFSEYNVFGFFLNLFTVCGVYIMMAVFKKSFKLQKSEIITLCSILAFMLIFEFISVYIYNAYIYGINY